ncbi:hypothetical protein [Fictibacillus macauensis]|uniref:hypothetical protein n=1 Tax=Fictibacillus macauensis TaxID=245160 RepID=UPI00067FAB3D|nr:hypothetical protein [Fictibacillus macauensis]
MANWFPRNEMNKEYTQSLENRIQQLETMIEKLTASTHHHYHIEKIELQQPMIENLSFNLESIDIEELSGALNLGNNFGVSVDNQTTSTKEREQRENQSLFSQGTMTKNESGYSFSFARNQKGE